MKKEQYSSDWIDRFRDNDLNEVEKLLFLEQLKRNQDLRQEFELDRHFDQLMGDADTLEFLEILQTLPAREEMMKKRIRRILAAATLAGILVLGSVYLLLHQLVKEENTASTLQNTEMNNPGIKSEDEKSYPKKSATDPELIRKKPSYDIGKRSDADLYQPLLEYEWLVGAQYRDGALELAFPAPDTTIFLDDTINFRWFDTSGEDEKITFIIVDNKGKVVRESFFDRDAHGVSVQAKTLGPGLFYWKLIVADNIAGMGKMTIFRQ